MGLRRFRRILALVAFVCAVAWFMLGSERFPAGRMVAALQPLPSALAVTLGATIFWIAMTLLFGRIYCATLCPAGTLMDLSIWTRRRFRRHARPFRYRQASSARFTFVWLYLATLVMGWLPLAFVMEPWNMTANMVSVANHQAVAATWGTLGKGTAIGVTAGVVSLVTLTVWAWVSGRSFCNTVCPFGTAMGLTAPWNMYHMEIDPDLCTNCMKCEEVCPAGCVKVVSRYVDNSRCVCCFECTGVCGNNAIRYQANRNKRPATPLMRKINQAKT